MIRAVVCPLCFGVENIENWTNYDGSLATARLEKEGMTVQELTEMEVRNSHKCGCEQSYIEAALHSLYKTRRMHADLEVIVDTDIAKIFLVGRKT